MMIADLGDLRAPTAGAKTGPPARIASSSVQTGPAARRSEAATNPDVTCRSLGMREPWPGGRQAAGGGCILWTGPAAVRGGGASRGGVGGLAGGARGRPGGAGAAGGGCILGTAPAAVRGWWASRGWMGGLAGGADVRRGRAGDAGGCPIGAVPRISPG